MFYPLLIATTLLDTEQRVDICIVVYQKASTKSMSTTIKLAALAITELQFSEGVRKAKSFDKLLITFLRLCDVHFLFLG